MSRPPPLPHTVQDPQAPPTSADNVLDDEARERARDQRRYITRSGRMEPELRFRVLLSTLKMETDFRRNRFGSANKVRFSGDCGNRGAKRRCCREKEPGGSGERRQASGKRHKALPASRWYG